MDIVEIHLAITFESCLISSQNSELKITVCVYKIIAEINTILIEMNMVWMKFIVFENSIHYTMVQS